MADRRTRHAEPTPAGAPSAGGEPAGRARAARGGPAADGSDPGPDPAAAGAGDAFGGAVGDGFDDELDEPFDDDLAGGDRGAEESHRGGFGEFGGTSGGLIERTFREKIILVGLVQPPATVEEVEASLDELARLVDTAGADVVDRVIQRRQHPARPRVTTAARCSRSSRARVPVHLRRHAADGPSLVKTPSHRRRRSRRSVSTLAWTDADSAALAGARGASAAACISDMV